MPLFMPVLTLQDINTPQYELIKMLRKGSTTGSVFVVGDPDQAIYAWRGANPVNMEHNFAQDFPGCVTMHLKDNYR
jgi:DNA helicase-2/ATP-dependent DNA helicase PcrA